MGFGSFLAGIIITVVVLIYVFHVQMPDTNTLHTVVNHAGVNIKQTAAVWSTDWRAP